jgi:plasmid stabilization system protein ParE
MTNAIERAAAALELLPKELHEAAVAYLQKQAQIFRELQERVEKGLRDAKNGSIREWGVEDFRRRAPYGQDPRWTTPPEVNRMSALWMRVFVTQQADNHLVGHYRIFEKNTPDKAVEFAYRVNSAFAERGEFPHSGRDRSLISPGLRSVAMDPFMIYFKVEPDGIVIIGVMHNRVDLVPEFQR